MAATETIWRRLGMLAAPASEEAVWELLSVADGDYFLSKGIRRPRNIKQLRQFWALMGLVAANDDSYQNKDTEAVRRDIFTVIGEMEEWNDRWGQKQTRPKSIAFESMEQTEFNNLYTRCVNVVCQWTGSQPKEIQDEVFAMIADKRHNNPRR